MDTLIDSINETVLRPEAWPRVLKAIAETLNAKDASIVAFNSSTGVADVISLPLDPDFTRQYIEYWSNKNFLWEVSLQLPVGQQFCFETAMPRETFHRTAFYNEWWKPQEMEFALGANVLNEGCLSIVATVCRPASRSDFNSIDSARFSELLPHLQRAMQIRERLASAELGQADFRATLDTLNKAAFLVDRDSRVLYANKLAERLIIERVLLVSGHKKLSVWATNETNALHRLVFHAGTNASYGAGGKIAIHRKNGRAVTAVVSALHRSNSVFSTPATLILIDDPEQYSLILPDLDFLRSMYQFTKAEARLAIMLLRGMTLQQAADDLKVTSSTVRVHLAHIFQKAEVHSQAALVRLLMNNGLER